MPTPTTPGPLHGLHLLLADDSPLTRDYVRLLAEDWGATLDEASTGPEAVALLTANAYDGVLMDLQLPGLSGIAATRHLRAHPDAARAATPVVAFSGSQHPQTQPGYAEAGFRSHLAKPFLEPDLYATLAALRPTPARPYNLAPLHALAQGRPEFVRKLLRSFVTNMPASLAALQAAAAAAHWPEVARLAHHIKPNLLALHVTGVELPLDTLLYPPLGSPMAHLQAVTAVVGSTEAALQAAGQELGDSV